MQLESQLETVALTVGPGAGPNAKAASVDVVEDWELGGGGGCRFVEAELEVVGKVEDDIFPED